MNAAARPPFWKSPLGWACLALVAVAAAFAAAGHAAYVLSVLAWLAILACPLMHIFLHRHHRRHGHDRSAPAPRGE
jgi:hypothetical protein